MNTRSFLKVLWIPVVLTCLISCQKDNYEEPKIVPKTYVFNIPNKISFNFTQQSLNRESVIPYSNTLVIKNIDDKAFLIDYAIFAFENELLNYSNLAFIKHASKDLAQGNLSDSIALEKSNALFSDKNLIATVLNFNTPESDHEFNGLYNGELNVFIPTATDTTFQKSLTCTGIIDYQGKFDFFIEDLDEDNIVRLKGNFNSDNLISGIILNRNASNLSSIVNIKKDTLRLDILSLKGNIKFTENTEERILKFNLTKQN